MIIHLRLRLRIFCSYEAPTMKFRHTKSGVLNKLMAKTMLIMQLH